MEVESSTIDFRCPECKQEFQIRLYQLLNGGLVVCPMCRATNAGTTLRELEHGLRDIDKSLQNLKKCLNTGYYISS